jgi:hypothetical protein
MTDIRMADVSEFQGNVDAPAYLAAGNHCIIARAYSGYRPDHTMPGRRDYLRGQPFTGVGWYAYLAADRDPTAQAHEFVQTIGQLKGNEWPALDLEEGGGDQTGRAQAWLNVVDAWAGFPAMIYSGASFFNDHLGGTGHWKGRPVWIAAYQSTEPSAAHMLWQFSDSYSFAGIGSCDGSLHHGTAQEFMTAVRAGAGPSPQPRTPEETVAITAAQNANGSLHVFVESKDGSVWYTYQSKGESSWNGGEPGKKIAGLVRFAPAPGK